MENSGDGGTRLERQLSFINEIDMLKDVERQTLILAGRRQENDAEHSWHIAVMALVLAEYAKERDFDLARVMTLLLIHDLVEIDAGDTYCYDEDARQDQYDRENRAAERIFGMLPADQARHFQSLWYEFESRSTVEARFAAALDRLQPLIHNYRTEGRMWQAHGITADRVRERMSPLKDGAPALWRYALSLIDDAVERGYLTPAPRDGG